MGFYIRKSIRVGPLRFNFSKSGIGVSAGIRGFRVGTGPRGNYVHMGVGGLYYRATLPSNSTSSAPLPTQEPTTFEQTTTHAPLENVSSGSVSRMVDSSSAALLSELNQKSQRILTWPLAAGTSGILAISLVATAASPWIVIPVVVLSIVGVFCAYQLDQLRKTVVILYDFDGEMERAYQRIHDLASQLARCGGKWHIDARGQVYDPKFHGGAGHVVIRRRISIGTGQPPNVKTNVSTVVIPLGTKTLYFFPDRLLVFAGNGVGAVSYHDLSIVVNERQFLEGDSVPLDARVVGQTWLYVNKSGGPDRRFKNNPQIPICLYEDLWLNSPSGLNEMIQISRSGIGHEFNEAIQGLADLVAKASAPPTVPLRHAKSSQQTSDVAAKAVHAATQQPSSDGSPTAETGGRDRVFDVMLEILCCLMVADGRASSAEKKRIREIMTKVRSPWSDSQIDDRISSFIDRVKTDGYRRTLDRALKDVQLFKHMGKQDVLLKCLDVVAHADGTVSDRELQLCQRVKTIVE